jgi:hypothetical protein
MVKGFRKYCISTIVDGSDDGMLWNGSEEVRHSSSQCEEDDFTDYEVGCNKQCRPRQTNTDW